jgi:hypothetical protein
MMADKNNKPKFSDLDKWDDLFDKQFKDDKRELANLYNGLQRKGKPLKAETKAKMSAARKGRLPPNKGKSHSLETRYKISVGNKGKIQSKETKAKLRAAHLGKIITEETKAKLSAANKGKFASEETKAKLSAVHMGKTHPIVTCPHCGKEGGARHLKRYHFDNCKFK